MSKIMLSLGYKEGELGFVLLSIFLQLQLFPPPSASSLIRRSTYADRYICEIFRPYMNGIISVSDDFESVNQYINCSISYLKEGEAEFLAVCSNVKFISCLILWSLNHQVRLYNCYHKMQMMNTCKSILKIIRSSTNGRYHFSYYRSVVTGFYIISLILSCF